MLELTPLISLINLTARKSGQIVLQNLHFQLRSGECWAIVGPTGSGKTTFLQILAGQLLPIFAAMLTRNVLVEFVAFKEESSRFSYSSYFYQQRYQATMSDNPAGSDAGYQSIPTLRDYLQLAESLENNLLVERLGLMPLIDRSFLKLSNGQTRKARIGKALLRYPKVLLLDNPFVGLDTTFRAELTNWLGELTEHGLTLMLVTEPDKIPPFVTHVISLNNGTVQWMGSRENYDPERQPMQAELATPTVQTKAQSVDFLEAFRLRDVIVRYDDTIILKAINWTVRAGERWALLGRNGAGKSVLLSLLYGDHPQAYANDISVFGHRRGKSGESIWDVKRRIGFVSPELHLYFPQQLLVRQVILTGLTDTLTPPKRVLCEAETDLVNLLTYFGLAHTADRSFGTLSAGEQRLVLFVRALLKNPPVLLLDEPFQAMDAHHIQLARQLIDSYSEKTILFITHDRCELPASINQVFDLTSLPGD